MYICANLSKYRFMNISESVKRLCKEKGTSLADIADKIGVSASSLSQIMKGNPTLSKLTDIAAALDVSVADLLSEGSSSVKCPRCGAVLEIKEK